MGGKVESNEVHEPTPYGYFANYWSCAFVRVEGGAPLAASYSPLFVNDMSQFSEDGCMAANDALGICSVEPCAGVIGEYQVPKQFKDGNKPDALISKLFGGSVTDQDEALEVVTTSKPSVSLAGPISNAGNTTTMQEPALETTSPAFFEISEEAPITVEDESFSSKGEETNIAVEADDAGSIEETTSVADQVDEIKSVQDAPSTDVVREGSLVDENFDTTRGSSGR